MIRQYGPAGELTIDVKTEPIFSDGTGFKCAPGEFLGEVVQEVRARFDAATGSGSSICKTL